jgi:cytochrome c oxidase subunit 1
MVEGRTRFAFAAAPRSYEFVRKYIFSLDHKVIGLQYALTSLVFLLIGFCSRSSSVAACVPGQPCRSSELVRRTQRTRGVDTSRVLQPAGRDARDDHGVPRRRAAVSRSLWQLPDPAADWRTDMAFPRLNMASYWTYLRAAVVMLASFFVSGGAPNSGWTVISAAR